MVEINKWEYTEREIYCLEINCTFSSVLSLNICRLFSSIRCYFVEKKNRFSCSRSNIWWNTPFETIAALVHLLFFAVISIVYFVRSHFLLVFRCFFAIDENGLHTAIDVLLKLNNLPTEQTAKTLAHECAHIEKLHSILYFMDGIVCTETRGN